MAACILDGESPEDLISEDEAGADLTFGVGLLTVLVIPFASAKTDTLVRRHTRGGILRSGGVLRPVWPDPVTPLVWPPPEQLDRAGMEDSTRSFQTFEPLTSLSWRPTRG